MHSLIAKELKLKYHSIAIYFSDYKPEKAHQFRENKWGCAMAHYNIAMKLGKAAAFDRKTYGCIGAGVGLCLGNTYEKNREFMENLLCDEEGYLKSHELVRDFMDNFPYVDIPRQYVVFKPLEMVDAKKETPALISFPVNADQLAALAVLINFRRPGNEHVAAPFCAGCQSVCVIPYNELNRQYPRGIIGNLDLSSRKVLPPDILTFTVPYKTFLEMEEDAPQCFFQKKTWLQIAERLEGSSE